LKGVELPINAIIIILLCIAVLLAVITMFFGVWRPGQGSISLEAAKSSGCQMLSSMGCNAMTASIPIRGFDANKDGTLSEGSAKSIITTATTCPLTISTQDNLLMLCQCWYLITGADENAVDSKCKKQVCGCQESGTGGSGSGGGACSGVTCSAGTGWTCPLSGCVCNHATGACS
jgi:hypothetical protein